MVFRGRSSLACATVKFDGTLLYPHHLVGLILADESGIYLNQILSCHRLGETPEYLKRVKGRALVPGNIYAGHPWNRQAKRGRIDHG